MTLQDNIIMTADDFDEWVNLPENQNCIYEFIAGEIVEVPSNPFVSKIAGLILTFINIYLFKHDIGHATGEAGGYMVAGERYAPDVAFITYEKQAELAKKGYNPNPPDLAVEVVSSDSTLEQQQLSVKLGNYLSVSTMVWIVYPDTQTIHLFEAGKATKVYRQKDSIKLESVLPGLKLKLSDIFKVAPEFVKE